MPSNHHSNHSSSMKEESAADESDFQCLYARSITDQGIRDSVRKRVHGTTAGHAHPKFASRKVLYRRFYAATEHVDRSTDLRVRLIIDIHASVLTEV